MDQNKKRIAVLVSGGVDSAVVVDILSRRDDLDLHLFYIRIGMDNGEGGCSAEEDLEICRLIAHKYNLPLHEVSLHEEYWDHVMKYTLRAVGAGLTPHPDMMCNKLIKFGFFEERWGKDFDAVATGHYADIVEIEGKRYLATATDPVKDQTDFLAQISGEQLSHLMFPLGKYPKSEVRRMADAVRLPNASRKDSQGICFLGKINYVDFLKRHLGEKEGPVVEIETGKKIGTHKGYWFYTIGQRKGLGLSGGPWYVVRKNIRDNVVYVSNGYDTAMQYGRIVPIEEINWITVNPFDEDSEGAIRAIDDQMHITFKTRHTPQFQSGKLKRLRSGSFVIEADEDVQGIAPGQFGIIYSPDSSLCLGSGMISLPSKKHKHRQHEKETSPSSAGHHI